ncbi:saccharopine dehydrogenase family protein [Actinokineospora sp.]|uniref:saccharopine dehydrogenase family protein n=1 Tax=Actinokineospora sp. TaxID=1872133 RepID=UPI004038031B
MPTGRKYDIVLFGATGFTGELTAEYLARTAPAATRWALAGRNEAKLTAVRSKLAAIDPALAELDLLTADVTDPASLRAVAEAARVVITTVGPYINFGDPLVAACAEAGTDYVDLTGEPEFVDQTYLRHHARAVETGARIVHCCGFESIPYDLGAYFTVQQLPEGVPITMEGFVSASGIFSGGTFHSAVTAFSRLRSSAKAASDRRKAEGRPVGRKVRGVAGKPRHESAVEAWALPAPTVDPQIVLRSARALDRYGPEFSYGHYLAIKKLPVALGLAGGVAGLVALAQVPFARNWLLGRKKAGDGPTAERRAKSWFRVRFIAEGGGKRVVTEVSGGDPGYGETAKMLGESALCLAFDKLPKTSGQVTTAMAMGDALTDRVIAAGIKFSVLEGPS